MTDEKASENLPVSTVKMCTECRLITTHWTFQFADGLEVQCERCGAIVGELN